MAIDLNTGFTLIKALFTNTTFFEYEWLLGGIIVLVTMIAITRNTQTWKQLGLPLVILYHIIGLTMSPLMFHLSAMIFVIGLFDIAQLGNLLTASTKTFEQVSISDMKIKSLEELELNRISKSLAKQNRINLMNKELKKDLVIDTNIIDDVIAKTKGIRRLNKSEIDKMDIEKKNKKRLEINSRLKQIAAENRAKGTAFQRAINKEKKKTQNIFSGINENYISRGLNEITKKKRKNLYDWTNDGKNAYTQLRESGKSHAEAFEEIAKNKKNLRRRN